MIIGIPKGLLYYKYHPFIETFFKGLGAGIVLSPDTNKEILNEGIRYCVDEACLPIKVFHGHVAYLRDRSDMIFIPRIMQIRNKEYICPKFCGLPEMVENSIPNLPKIMGQPIYADPRRKLYKWAQGVGYMITRDRARIMRAFNQGLRVQEGYDLSLGDREYPRFVALVGHPYNLYDEFINMDIVRKLNRLGIGVVTEDYIEGRLIDRGIKDLYKRPFWTFARNSYGFVSHISQDSRLDGIIYISSFACGIDSVIIELVKEKLGDIPLMILKIDEHTGEAGFNTRIEAFADMLGRD